MPTCLEEFRCPQCDGKTWGSSASPDGSRPRSCHGTMIKFETSGITPVPCDFKWPEEDDWKYHQMVIKKDDKDDPIFRKVIETFYAHMREGLNPIVEGQTS